MTELVEAIDMDELIATLDIEEIMTSINIEELLEALGIDEELLAELDVDDLDLELLEALGIDIHEAALEAFMETFDVAAYLKTLPVNIGIVITHRDENEAAEGRLVTVEFTVSLGTIPLNQVTAPITLTVPLLEDTYDGRNPYRFVAETNPILGGMLNPDTGEFVIRTTYTGTFNISYIDNLSRLALNLNSPIITDLAGNAPDVEMDVLPIAMYNRTFVPIRFIAYALGAEVGHRRPTATMPTVALITLNGVTLEIPIGILTPELEALGMDVPAFAYNGRTMVPLRFVSEYFGALVEWDRATQSIDITVRSAHGQQAPAPDTGAGELPPYKQEDDPEPEPEGQPDPISGPDPEPETTTTAFSGVQVEGLNSDVVVVGNTLRVTNRSASEESGIIIPFDANDLRAGQTVRIEARISQSMLTALNTANSALRHTGRNVGQWAAFMIYVANGETEQRVAGGDPDDSYGNIGDGRIVCRGLWGPGSGENWINVTPSTNTIALNFTITQERLAILSAGGAIELRLNNGTDNDLATRTALGTHDFYVTAISVR
jgi:hypothetical protein